MIEEIHNLLKIENDKTTIFTNQELKGYLIQEIDTFKEILSKYYEIIDK